jgi:serine/threonine-protein kinase
MKICPDCRLGYPDDASVCGQCGQGLVLEPPRTYADPQTSMVGRVIGGNYRVERLLGKGGMGAVFEARQLSLDRKVAIKVLLSPLAMEGEMLERFQREARAASNIGHPGIVQVIDLGYLEEGLPFIAMEMLEGEDMRSKLYREGALGLSQAIPLMLQVCDALQAAHDKGIVHRDLKPDNIFLTYRPGKVPMVKLLDFGLSKIKGTDQKLTNTGALLGTPNYMSPEQVKGDRAVDHRTDIYASGAILYEMVTGRPAYDGPSIQSILVSIITEDFPPPRRIRPDLPDALESIVLRAMARDPNDRYQTMNEVGYDLSRLASQVGLSSSRMDVMATPSGPGAPPFARPPWPPPLPTPQVTPPPMSIPASSVTRRPSGAGKLVLGGVLAAALLAVIAVVLGGAALVAILVGSRDGKKDEHTVALENLIEEQVESEIESGMKGLFSQAGEKHEAPAAADAPVATGSRPYVCCGKKACGLVYQREESGGRIVYLRRLGSKLEPLSQEVALSPGDKDAVWPMCFARDDGGFLVLYQEPRDPFDMSSDVDIHRLVVDDGGKAGTRKTTTVKNGIGVDDFEPGYAAARAGDRVMVVWNHFHKADSGVRFMVIDMDGAVIVPEVKVHSKPWVNATSVACGEKRCIIAWVRPSLPMNHIRKFAIVTTAGDVIEADRTVFDRGVLVRSSMVLPAKGGVAMVWGEQDSKGNMTQWLARYDWSGKETLAPTRIEAFGKSLPQYEHMCYAVGDPDKTGIAIARPVTDESSGVARGLVAIVGEKGELLSKTEVAPGDDDVAETFVFGGPGSGLALVTLQGIWGDGELRARLIEESK